MAALPYLPSFDGITHVEIEMVNCELLGTIYSPVEGSFTHGILENFGLMSQALK